MKRDVKDDAVQVATKGVGYNRKGENVGKRSSQIKQEVELSATDDNKPVTCFGSKCTDNRATEIV